MKTVCITILVLIFYIWMCIIHIDSKYDSLKEGMVMNKLTSSETCTKKSGCEDDQKWILAVQKDDKKEWWLVTEDYYNQVETGNWVKK